MRLIKQLHIDSTDLLKQIEGDAVTQQRMHQPQCASGCLNRVVSESNSHARPDGLLRVRAVDDCAELA